MTPFPGRAGAAAHPKVKRRPPFSAPAAAPDHDYGAVGREITPRDPAGGSGAVRRARCPATATRRPCRRRPRPYPWGQYLGRLRDLQPSADLGPVGGAGGSAPAPAGRLRAPYVDAQAADGPFKGRGGGGVSVRRPAVSRRAPGLSTGEMARRLRGAVVVRTRALEDGRRAVTSHAELLSIDHRFLLVGSANLSCSAEERSVELGLRLDDPALAHGVEKAAGPRGSGLRAGARVTGRTLKGYPGGVRERLSKQLSRGEILNMNDLDSSASEVFERVQYHLKLWLEESGGTRSDIEYTGLGSSGMIRFWMTVDGQKKPVRISECVGSAVTGLRDAQALPGRGAWFYSHLWMELPEGVLHQESDWMCTPDMEDIADLGAYKTELDRYPRDQEFIPDWLRDRVEQWRLERGRMVAEYVAEMEEEYRLEGGEYRYP